MDLIRDPTPAGRLPILLRARVVLPVSSPPIEDGVLALLGNRILWVGAWRDLSRAERSAALDLGEMILLPGLINAHCHLDYTFMAGQISPPKTFVDWLKLITTAKSGLTYSDFAESWLRGAAMLVRTGTTTVGDVEMAPELIPDVWTATPLRVFSFLEMTGVRSRRPPADILREALDTIAAVPRGRCRLGLSPHAPYSTTPELLRLAAETGRNQRLRLVTHVAESEPEFEMFVHGRGKMFDWISRNGRDMSDCGLGTPVEHLERCGALDRNLMAVHANYLGPGDAALLGRRRTSVVHCPRSHAYFQHRPFPLAELLAARVNVCLGTDSLASVQTTRKQAPELNMFEEMRQLAAASPALAPETLLRLATINGARALGFQRRLGELAPKALADLIAIPHAGKAEQALEAVVQHRGPVTAVMIDGKWVFAPSEITRDRAASPPG